MILHDLIIITYFFLDRTSRYVAFELLPSQHPLRALGTRHEPDPVHSSSAHLLTLDIMAPLSGMFSAHSSTRRKTSICVRPFLMIPTHRISLSADLLDLLGLVIFIMLWVRFISSLSTQEEAGLCLVHLYISCNNECGSLSF